MTSNHHQSTHSPTVLDRIVSNAAAIGILVSLIVGVILVMDKISSSTDKLTDKLNATEVRLTDKLNATEKEFSDKLNATEVRLTEKIERTEKEFTDKLNATEVRLTEKIERTEKEFTDKLEKTENKLTARLEEIEAAITTLNTDNEWIKKSLDSFGKSSDNNDPFKDLSAGFDVFIPGEDLAQGLRRMNEFNDSKGTSLLQGAVER